MCSYTTLKNNCHGYVIQCSSCNHIQVAFGTLALTLTIDQFMELIETTDALFQYHRAHPFQEQKLIQVPTVCRAVTMVFSVTELKNFIALLIEGRNKLQYKKLFVFNDN